MVKCVNNKYPNNPNIIVETDKRTPEQILAEIESLNIDTADIIQAIKKLL